MRGALVPLATHGVLSDATPGKLIYDAVTTSGGSGGPVIGPEGTVIAVNFAMLREFQGSNFGVPIRYVQALIRTGPNRRQPTAHVSNKADSGG